mmetsp:Transcript_30911/g.76080  ORF Transcript_30911/g.76080 Transcript_30911/m.76080 type:complete len:224 (+) Transcript_30911:177-848(+)
MRAGVVSRVAASSRGCLPAAPTAACRDVGASGPSASPSRECDNQRDRRRCSGDQATHPAAWRQARTSRHSTCKPLCRRARLTRQQRREGGSVAHARLLLRAQPRSTTRVPPPHGRSPQRLFEQEHDDHRATEQQQQVDAQHRFRLFLVLVRLAQLQLGVADLARRLLDVVVYAVEDRPLVDDEHLDLLEDIREVVDALRHLVDLLLALGRQLIHHHELQRLLR